MEGDCFTHMHALVGHIEKVEDRLSRHPRSGKMCGKWKGEGKARTRPAQPIYPDLVLHASTHTNRGQLAWLATKMATAAAAAAAARAQRGIHSHVCTHVCTPPQRSDKDHREIYQ